MGSSYVTFRGRGFEADDSALEIWLALLVREIDELTDVPDWLREVRDEWHLQSTAGFGFGVMLGLDRFIDSEEKRRTMIDIGGGVLSKLEARGPVIPREELNSLGTGGEGAEFTLDVPVSDLARPARYFIKLLQGNLEAWESDSRFEPTHKP